MHHPLERPELPEPAPEPPSDSAPRRSRSQREGLAAAPDNAWSHFNLARFLCAAGDTDDASARMDEAISLAPEMADVARGDVEFQYLCRGAAVPRRN